MTDTASFDLSDAAVKRLKTLLADEPNDAAFRVAVQGGGCSGFQYDFSFDRNLADDDLIIERDGVRVAIDPISLPFLAGAKLDFVDELIGASFRVVNPNASASCGCGVSFAV